ASTWRKTTAKVAPSPALDEGLTAPKCFVPLLDLPAAHNAVEHEWIAFNELLGSLASREDGHRAGQVGEGPDHQKLAPVAVLLPARLVLRKVNRRLLAHVVRRLVYHDVLLCHRAGFSPRYNVCLPSSNHA